MSGKVYLVGAGPGDAGLLTLSGRAVLSRADVVVYDALVGPAVLAMAPAGARCVDAGKRAGRHTLAQSEIHDLLLAEALAGRTVVRLQGGDPFLFGRGGEELAFLRSRGVPCEVIPGVSAALAAPACAGLPVTHREAASSVHILTAHRQAGAPLELDFASLARLEGTLVFLMGLAALPALCRGLLEAGMDPETPAAAVSRGSTAGQRQVQSSLAALPEAARGLEAPAVIVVGRVCALSQDWRAALPLGGKLFLVTRPRERAASLLAGLRALGAEAVPYPTVALQPLPGADLSALADCRWLALTSPSGVDIFFDRLRALGRDVRSLSHLRIAALGAGTAAALAARGVFADLVPETYDTASLGEALAAILRPGERVLLARARAGSPELPRCLPPGSYYDVPLYETVFHKPALPALPPLLEAGARVVFTSASTVRGLAAATGRNLTGVPALCIGRQTAEAAQEFGMNPYIARTATVDGLVELALEVP
ncbi:MAG: uroporphyrinogen-III C-methyltransferase [Oscillospiraceae bacterium]|nr:uroporphyrinogen-III C-methyltransferase [Oscillospiraceae bacterium]